MDNKQKIKPKVNICKKCGWGIPLQLKFCPNCRRNDERDKIDPKGAAFANFLEKLGCKVVTQNCSKDTKSNSKPKKNPNFLSNNKQKPNGKKNMNSRTIKTGRVQKHNKRTCVQNPSRESK